MWQQKLSSHAVISAGFLALGLSASLAFAAEGPLPAYAERIWGMQDGLPEQIVQAFAQTKDRYLWIGTTGGLLRFDGARFVLYNRENTPAFTDNNIFCLTVSRDNALWIGSEGGGLIRYSHGVFHSFSSDDGLTNSFVRTVYEDRDGTIWVGTDNGLFRLAGTRLQRVDNTSTFPVLPYTLFTRTAMEACGLGVRSLCAWLATGLKNFGCRAKPAKTESNHCLRPTITRCG